MISPPKLECRWSGERLHPQKILRFGILAHGDERAVAKTGRLEHRCAGAQQVHAQQEHALSLNAKVLVVLSVDTILLVPQPRTRF